MSSQPSNFRRTDIKRAVQAMQAAGLRVARVKLRRGTVLIIPAEEDGGAADDSNNSFDKIMRKPGGGVMFLSTWTPMVLYHATPRSRLAQIRRKGLKPHVPGKFGACVIRRRPEINPSFGLRPIRPPGNTTAIPTKPSAIPIRCCLRS
jgi:hypothetical protein